MTTPELLLAKTRSPLRVGPEIARGGEGAVHTLPDATDKLLKLYLKPPDEAKRGKLQVMALGTSDTLTRVAAWPIELVTDRQGRTLGFVMPRAASATEAHELYTPKSRARTFPEADFRFLLHVAANIVRAFGTVHQAGYVIGDVNHGQVLVGHDGRVTLIDCDSFQVQANGQLFTCDVGVPLFTAPELQGRAFRGLHRTADHDRFGLAVMLFQLLFMGRHPYAGVPLDPAQSSEIEAAIKADRFAYGNDRRARGVEQPPGTLPLSTYGLGVSILFERAFARAPVTSRPDAANWLQELKALQATLKACSSSLAHYYPSHLTSCPWCSIEARTGTRLFGYKPKSGSVQGPLDIAALWGAVTAIPIPSPPIEPSTAGFKLPSRPTADQLMLNARRLRQLGALGVGCAMVVLLACVHQVIAGLAIGCAAAFVIKPRVRSADRKAALKTEADEKAAFEAAQNTWKAAAAGSAFTAIRQRCHEAKGSLEQLPLERQARLANLQSEGKQREAFLDRFRIVKGEITGIGAGRIANLNSFGIETAWDITAARIQAIPGFGPSTAAKLVDWRRGKEALFRFNPNHPIAAAELNAIEAEFGSRTQQLAGLLRSGPSLLQQASDDVSRVLAATGPLIEERWTAWQLAKRRRLDFYDGVGTSSPLGLLMVSVAVLIVFGVLLSQSVTTPPAAVGLAKTQSNEVASATPAPGPVPASQPAETSMPIHDNAVASQPVTENQTEAAIASESDGSQHSVTDNATISSAPPTPETTPALSNAVTEALDAGSPVTWQAGAQNGVVTVGEEKFFQGHPCRSFTYTVKGVTSALAYACSGADGVWRPEPSFSQYKQPSNSTDEHP